MGETASVVRLNIQSRATPASFEDRQVNVFQTQKEDGKHLV